MQVQAKNFITSFIQVFNGKTTILSFYVIKCIATKVDLAFFTQDKDILPGNPVWQGWVYKLKFLINIRKNKFTCEGNSMKWAKTGNIIELEDSKNLGNLVVKDNSWLVPLVPLQNRKY